MTRALLILLVATLPALAEPAVFLITGVELEHRRLVSADANTAVLESLVDQTRTEMPTTKVAAAAFDTEEDPAEDASAPINLHLANGDRLRGTVSGDGDDILFSGTHIKGLRIPLQRVRAVRFGRLMGGLQEKYRAVFEHELGKGKYVVVIQRDTRPFPVYARVISVRPNAIEVRVDDLKRELPAHRVYGFVQPVEGDDESTRAGLWVRLHLRNGTRVTVPLESVGETVISSGETRIDRAAVSRIEFLGGHVAHLSGFEPIDVQQRCRFGKPPRWRRNSMVLGAPLRLDGRDYPHGVGVQAYSRLEYVLGGRWSGLYVRCGIDDVAGREGEALFRILGDDKVLKEVRCRRGEKSVPVLIEVAGVERLVLETLPGDSYTSDFCDWAEARVFNVK